MYALCAGLSRLWIPCCPRIVLEGSWGDSRRIIITGTSGGVCMVYLDCKFTYCDYILSKYPNPEGQSMQYGLGFMV